MLTHLAAQMEKGDPLWAALPYAFAAVGIDPHEAVNRLATRRWQVSVLLEDLLPAEAIARIQSGEESAELVDSLRWARRHLPMTLHHDR